VATDVPAERWQRIEALYHAALQRSTDARTRFLNEQCADDPVLRVQVETLLSAIPSADRLFDSDPEPTATATPALLVGQDLSPYRLTAFLGAGGMGRVYRAHDPRLGRDVAIKVLPHLTADPDRLQRFRQEARAAAALNHPNIVTVFDVGEHAGVPFIVSELLDGETLRDVLRRGAVPARVAIAYAIELANGLAAAHDKGIIHCDIKPANVFVTHDGHVKVLDFGIARLTEAAEQSAVAADAPAAAIGTVGYMSPEQLRGVTVDRRTDVFSFGAVCYEMLTGCRAFRGDAPADVARSILQDDPPESTNAKAPEFADTMWIVRRCLEKSPQSRFESLRDVALLLSAAPAHATPVAQGAGIGSDDVSSFDRTGRRRFLAVAGAVAGLATIAVAFGAARIVRDRAPTTLQHLRLPLELGPDATSFDAGVPFALSRDGSRMVYRALGPGGRVQLVVRAFDRDQATPLAGTEGGGDPFFSPDGEFVAFLADSQLKKVSLRGGNPIVVCDGGEDGGTWTDDGNIVLPLHVFGPLYRVPATGGPPQPLTTLAGEASDRWPQVIPGAHAVIFTAAALVGDFEHATVEVQSLETGRRKTLVRDAYFGRYAASGHLVFIRRGILYAAPFDIRTLEVQGAAVPILHDIFTTPQRGLGLVDIAANGTLAYVQGRPDRRLVQVSADGRVHVLRPAPATYDYGLRVSPDSTRLAFAAPGAAFDLWTYDLVRDVMTRLTFDAANENLPVWSPDGTHVAYQCFIGQSSIPPKICWTRSDGAGEPTVLLQSNGRLRPYSFSPDGKLAFGEWRPDTKWDLWVVPIEDARTDHPRVGARHVLLKTAFNEDMAMISPDGRWVAYESDESGTTEVYVRPMFESVGKWRVSRDGGTDPVWSRAQRELVYRSSQGLMAATYEGNVRGFVPAAPRLLVDNSRAQAVVNDSHAWFDVTSDGSVVMIAREPDNHSAPHLTIAVNFFEELRKAAPAVER
jgi:serine/threonine-protein kinase